jgi:hypothetical protein
LKSRNVKSGRLLRIAGKKAGMPFECGEVSSNVKESAKPFSERESGSLLAKRERDRWRRLSLWNRQEW